VARARLVSKRQLEQEGCKDAQDPTIHVGRIASGDVVMKSAEHRDQIASKENIIAFEMEGAGVWEELQCIIVKGVTDYADCHKSKKWQNFAAATAASAAKALLEMYIQTDHHSLALRVYGMS
jgi:nucleoside phosphorylase